MGLDNGIILVLANKKIPEDFPSCHEDYWWVGDEKDVAKNGKLDVAYWRKCWNIREAIISVLHVGNDGGEYPIEAEDLPAIRRALIKFLHYDYWEEHSDSIWEYDDIVDTLLQILINLKWLEIYLKRHPEDSAYFYDSY